MLNVLGENYFVDFDEIEKYIDMSDLDDMEGMDELSISGTSEMRVNIIKYEMVKMMLDVILSEDIEVDEKLGLKSSNSAISVPFKIAFNSLLNKNLINHY
jgi:hypothetical protein